MHQWSACQHTAQHRRRACTGAYSSCSSSSGARPSQIWEQTYRPRTHHPSLSPGACVTPQVEELEGSAKKLRERCSGLLGAARKYRWGSCCAAWAYHKQQGWEAGEWRN
jgi:hypothetical protein